MWLETENFEWTQVWKTPLFWDSSLPESFQSLLVWRQHLIDANTKINSLDRTKENALRLVEICETLRIKCEELVLDTKPWYVDENLQRTWVAHNLYKIAPYNTKKIPEIEVWGKKVRVTWVLIRKIPMYQKYANYLLDILDKEWVIDFWI